MQYCSPPGLKLSLLAACLLGGAWAHAGTASTPLAVTATVLSKNNCKFSTTNVTTMDFLGVEAASPVDAVKPLTWTFSCKGSSATVSWIMSADDGLHASGAGQRRMQHGTVATEFLPYSLAISPASATATKGSSVTVTLTGTIPVANFQVALPGTYSDTVTITLSP